MLHSSHGSNKQRVCGHIQVHQQHGLNSEYSIKIEGSKGTKHVNPNKNHDLQVSEHEYDPIKHFMEIQQASSTISKEKQQQETDLSQMD